MPIRTLETVMFVAIFVFGIRRFVRLCRKGVAYILDEITGKVQTLSLVFAIPLPR